MEKNSLKRRDMLALTGLAVLGGCQTATRIEQKESLGVSFVLRDGDLPEDIAEACSLTVDQLCYHNGLKPEQFKAGRKIVLPFQNYVPFKLRGAPKEHLISLDSKFDLQYPDLSGNLKITPRAAWGAERTKSNVNPMGHINKITLHHTSEYPGMNELNDIQTIQAIARYHRDHLGWADIGYHYLIGRDGKIYEGRPRHLQGAHTGGHNENNLGITVVGDFVNKLPNRLQLDTLKSFLTEQLQVTHLGIQNLYGHRDLKPTQCPGEQLYRWLQKYRHHSV